MAFRATAVNLRRSVDFTVKFNGMLESKPEVQDFLRLEFGKKMYVHLPGKHNYEIIEARIRSGPHKGDGVHPKASTDVKLHSTFDLYAGEQRNGERKFLKTVHIYHDEDEFKAAEKKVKEVNQMSHEFAQESARMEKARRKAQAAEEAKLAAEAEQSGGDQAKDAVVTPKA